MNVLEKPACAEPKAREEAGGCTCVYKDISDRPKNTYFTI